VARGSKGDPVLDEDEGSEVVESAREETKHQVFAADELVSESSCFECRGVQHVGEVLAGGGGVGVRPAFRHLSSPAPEEVDIYPENFEHPRSHVLAVLEDCYENVDRVCRLRSALACEASRRFKRRLGPYGETPMTQARGPCVDACDARIRGVKV
jgi:hypothetical protein